MGEQGPQPAGNNRQNPTAGTTWYRRWPLAAVAGAVAGGVILTVVVGTRFGGPSCSAADWVRPTGGATVTAPVTASVVPKQSEGFAARTGTVPTFADYDPMAGYLKFNVQKTDMKPGLSVGSPFYCGLFKVRETLQVSLELVGDQQQALLMERDYFLSKGQGNAVFWQSQNQAPITERLETNILRLDAVSDLALRVRTTETHAAAPFIDPKDLLEMMPEADGAMGVVAKFVRWLVNLPKGDGGVGAPIGGPQEFKLVELVAGKPVYAGDFQNADQVAVSVTDRRGVTVSRLDINLRSLSSLLLESWRKSAPAGQVFPTDDANVLRAAMDRIIDGVQPADWDIVGKVADVTAARIKPEVPGALKSAFATASDVTRVTREADATFVDYLEPYSSKHRILADDDVQKQSVLLPQICAENWNSFKNVAGLNDLDAALMSYATVFNAPGVLPTLEGVCQGKPMASILAPVHGLLIKPEQIALSQNPAKIAEVISDDFEKSFNVIARNLRNNIKKDEPTIIHDLIVGNRIAVVYDGPPTGQGQSGPPDGPHAAHRRFIGPWFDTRLISHFGCFRKTVDTPRSSGKPAQQEVTALMEVDEKKKRVSTIWLVGFGYETDDDKVWRLTKISHRPANMAQIEKQILGRGKNGAQILPPIAGNKDCRCDFLPDARIIRLGDELRAAGKTWATDIKSRVEPSDTCPSKRKLSLPAVPEVGLGLGPETVIIQ